MNYDVNILKHITFGKVLLMVLAFAGVWILLRYLRRFFEAVSRNRPKTRFLVLLIEPAIRILAWFGALLFAFQELAPDRDALLAALGSVAIAIGLGAQDLIKNLVGGLVVVTDRPYQIGDRVRLGNSYGEIVSIGLRSTKLMTPDDTLVTVPNSEVFNSPAANANAGVPECMVVAEVYLPTDADVDVAMQVAHEAILGSPYTRNSKRTQVTVTDGFVEEPYVTVKLRAYVYDHRYEPEMLADITRRCKAEFRRLGLLAGFRESVN